MSSEQLALSHSLGEALQLRGWQVSTAESCTGGGVAETITAVSGSSGWFSCGFVTYSNLAKEKLLDVPATLFTGADAPGAVSEETVLAMARGAINVSGADVAVSTSGIAGPDGGSPDKPVGTVWIAWAVRDLTSPTLQSRARCFHFEGDRAAVREQSVVAALEGLLTMVDNQ